MHEYPFFLLRMQSPSAPESAINSDEEEEEPMWTNKSENYRMNVSTLYELQSDSARGKRRFRDIPCAVIFLLVFCLLSYCVGLSFTYGQPSLLPSPDYSIVEGEVSYLAGYEMGILKADAMYIFGGLLSALLLSIAWFELVKRASWYLIWGMVGTCVISLVLFGVFLNQMAHKFKSSELIFVAALCWITAAILCVVGYLIRHKIQFTVEVMHEAGLILAKVPEIYGIGLSFATLYLILTGLWISSFVHLWSIPTGYLLWNSEGSGGLNYLFDGSYRHLFWILLFGGFWTLSVFGFMEQYITSSILYQRLEQDSGLRKRSSAIAVQATKEAVTTSFGSLCFASILTGTAWFLGLFARLEFIKGKLPFKDFFITKVVVDIFTFILEWVSDYAVVYMALTGKAFLPASKTAVGLLKSEFSQTVITGLITSFVLVVGKLLCTVLVTVFIILLVYLKHDHIGVLSVLVLLVSTYYLLHLLSKIYTVATNTLLIYTLKDIAENKDTKEFKSPERLRNILLVSKVNV